MAWLMINLASLVGLRDSWLSGEAHLRVCLGGHFQSWLHHKDFDHTASLFHDGVTKRFHYWEVALSMSWGLGGGSGSLEAWPTEPCLALASSCILPLSVSCQPCYELLCPATPYSTWNAKQWAKSASSLKLSQFLVIAIIKLMSAGLTTFALSSG